MMAKIVYGTAWKKNRTADCVIEALKSGFRGIDTACQPKHYDENGVGEALRLVMDHEGIKREEIFIQTKFTSIDGQDPKNIPYDKNAPLSEQVQQSLSTSLKNLGLTYIDSLILHGPMRTHRENMTVWREFERFVTRGEVRQLGVSNFYDLSVLTMLYEAATIKPAVVQNRFYADTKYDQTIRQYCDAKEMKYQSFWTLSANPHILRDAEVMKLSTAKSKSGAQLFFAYLMQKGIVPLTGTTSLVHMKEDLEAVDIALSAEEMRVFDRMIEQ